MKTNVWLFSITEDNEEHLVVVLETNSQDLATDDPIITDAIRHQVGLANETSVYWTVFIQPKSVEQWYLKWPDNYNPAIQLDRGWRELTPRLKCLRTISSSLFQLL